MHKCKFLDQGLKMKSKCVGYLNEVGMTRGDMESRATLKLFCMQAPTQFALRPKSTHGLV